MVTLYFGFLQFRKFKLAVDIVSGKYTDPSHKHDGELSHFQALATAPPGTVGLGNIAGVGAALAIGGPGVLDDHGRLVRHGLQVRRVHARR